MKNKTSLRAALSACALASLLVACGGGHEGTAVQQGASDRATALKGGGGTVTPTVPSPLPTTAPAPDILVRESFGLGPDVLRPAGGKGVLKETWLHTPLNSFWVEWPGSKATAWLTPSEGQTWRLCGTNPSPYELPSPLQGDASNGFLNAGCAASEWFDLPVLVHPTALLPFTPPTTTAWSVSMEGYPSVVDGAYVAIGLTSSPLLTSNFESVGEVSLSLRKQEVMVNGPLVYELRLNGKTGTLLATGVVDDLTWNQMVISYDPVAQVMSASINGISLGSYPMALAIRYAGFEGVGILDNFVIRKLAAPTL